MKAKQQLIGSAYLVIALLVGLAIADISDDSDIINPNWKKPGWNRYHNNRPDEGCPAVEECKCPAVPECPKKDPANESPTAQEDYRSALVFYRKFVRRVFDERRLEAHPEDDFYKLRNIQFKISRQQVVKLKEALTASEIDAVVTDIVEQSEGSVYYAMAESLCWSALSLYMKASQSTIFLYWVLPAVVMLIVVGIAKLLHIRLWILIPLVAILLSYVITYRDCNNRLELDSLSKLMKTSDGRNPCNKHVPSNWFARFLHKDTEAECLEHLRSTYGMKRDFCDPTEVFIEMMAKLHLKYFETFVHQMVSIFKTSTASSGFVESLAICIFILLLVYLLMTVGIKYGLYAGGRFMADVVTRGRPKQAEGVQDGAQQAVPQLPFNININITKPRRVNSRIESIPSRVEEITESAASETEALPAPEVVGESPAKAEDGSGDGPAKVTQPMQLEDCDDSSSDESIIIVQGELPDEMGQVASDYQRNNDLKSK